MAFQSIVVTANSDLLTVLNQLNANNLDNQAKRVKMQDGILSYKIWSNNGTSTVGIYKITSGAVSTTPESTLTLTPYKTGFYRITFVIPMAYPYAGAPSACRFYCGIMDNGLFNDVYPSTTSGVLWGRYRSAESRFTFPDTDYWNPLYCPTVLQVDRWLTSGNIYSISGILYGDSGDGRSISPTIQYNSGQRRTGYIEAHYLGEL